MTNIHTPISILPDNFTNLIYCAKCEHNLFVSFSDMYLKLFNFDYISGVPERASFSRYDEYDYDEYVEYIIRPYVEKVFKFNIYDKNAYHVVKYECPSCKHINEWHSFHNNQEDIVNQY